MTKTKKKYPRIKPNYIKDAKGKIIQVFLDMKSYDSMINRIQEFEAIIKTSKTEKKATKTVAKKAKV